MTSLKIFHPSLGTSVEQWPEGCRLHSPWVIPGLLNITVSNVLIGLCLIVGLFADGVSLLRAMVLDKPLLNFYEMKTSIISLLLPHLYPTPSHAKRAQVCICARTC